MRVCVRVNACVNACVCVCDVELVYVDIHVHCTCTGFPTEGGHLGNILNVHYRTPLPRKIFCIYMYVYVYMYTCRLINIVAVLRVPGKKI